MGLYNPKVRGIITASGKRFMGLPKPEYDEFKPDVLGIGNIREASLPTEAMCAVFDLADFTHFCKQVDPHLVVPEFLSAFLDWLFNSVKEKCKQANRKEGIQLYSPLPFFAKYMGDGVLFLWDVENVDTDGTRNIAIQMRLICSQYVSDFLPAIRAKVVDPPSRLRCGVARGRVYSVGDGQDFVGPCINISSRLQKIANLSFCCSRRGLDFASHPDESKRLNVKMVTVRGVGDHELVYVIEKEFAALPDDEKALFTDP